MPDPADQSVGDDFLRWMDEAGFETRSSPADDEPAGNGVGEDFVRWLDTRGGPAPAPTAMQKAETATPQPPPYEPPPSYTGPRQGFVTRYDSMGEGVEAAERLHGGASIYGLAPSAVEDLQEDARLIGMAASVWEADQRKRPLPLTRDGEQVVVPFPGLAEMQRLAAGETLNEQDRRQIRKGREWAKAMLQERGAQQREREEALAGARSRLEVERAGGPLLRMTRMVSRTTNAFLRGVSAGYIDVHEGVAKAAGAVTNLGEDEARRSLTASANETERFFQTVLESGGELGGYVGGVGAVARGLSRGALRLGAKPEAAMRLAEPIAMAVFGGLHADAGGRRLEAAAIGGATGLIARPAGDLIRSRLAKAPPGLREILAEQISDGLLEVGLRLSQGEQITVEGMAGSQLLAGIMGLRQARAEIRQAKARARDLVERGEGIASDPDTLVPPPTKVQPAAQQLADGFRDPRWVRDLNDYASQARLDVDMGRGERRAEPTAPAARQEPASRVERAEAPDRPAGPTRRAVHPPEPVAPPVRRGPDIPAAVGAEQTVDVPGGGKRSVRYAVVEIDDLRPSHDPQQGFAVREDYPPGLQPRDYAGDTRLQHGVRDRARALNPERLVSDVPTASEGPPTVTRDGVVVNGNGRVMSLGLLDEGRQEAMRRLLVERAERFGVDPSAVEGMRRPVLVRVTDLDAGSPEARRFAREGNVTQTFTDSPIREAASLSKIVDDADLAMLAADPELTFAQVVNDPTRGRRFRRALELGLPQEQRSRYFQEDGALTDAGKELANNVILTRALPVETVEKLSPRQRRVVMQAAPQLVEARTDPTIRQFVDAMGPAADYIRRNLDAGGARTLDDALAQGALFRSGSDLTAEQAMMVDFLVANADKPRVFRDRLADAIRVQKQEGALFAADDPVAAVADALGVPHRSAGGSRVGEPVGASGGLFGSPVRRAGEGGFGVPLRNEPTPAADITGKRVGVHEVMRTLQAVTEVPIRLRRATRGAEGHFDPHQATVRLRRANDIGVAIHEVAHAIEGDVMPEMPKSPTLAKELHDLGYALYGDVQPNAGYHREGWAEFVRMWAADRPALDKAAPETVRWFEETWLPSDKTGLRKRLEAMRGTVERFQSQSPEQRAQANIASTGRPSVRQRIGDILRPSELKRRVVEGMQPLEEAARLARQKLAEQGAILAPENDPYLVGSRLRGSAPSVVDTWIRDGITTPEGSIVGPSLSDVLQVGRFHGRDGVQRMNVLLQARRTLERAPKGKATGMDPSDAEAIWAGVKPHERMALSKYDEANRAVLEYARDMGALSDDGLEKILASSLDYAPLQRVFEDASGRMPSIPGKAGRPGSPLKKQVGSMRRVRDPLQVTAENWMRIAEWANRHRVAKLLADLRDVPGMGRYIEGPHPPDAVRDRVSLDQVRKQLEDLGVEVPDEIPDVMLDVWRQKRDPSTKPDSLEIRLPGKDGKPAVYTVSEGIYRAIEGVDTIRLNTALGRFGMAWNRLYKAGTTGVRPGFAAVNVIRDFLGTTITSKAAKGPHTALPILLQNIKSLLDVARTRAGEAAPKLRKIPVLGQVFNPDPALQLLERTGVDMATFMGYDSPRAQRAIQSISRTFWQRARDPRELSRMMFDLYAGTIQAGELAPRLAEFRRVLKSEGWRPGQPVTPRMIQEAGLAAKRVSVDFTAGSDFVRRLNAITPYLNSGIQGKRTLVRAFRENPIGATSTGFMLFGGLSLLNHAMYEDEPWAEQLTWRDRLTAWHFPAGDGRLVKIPKPHDFGLVFSAPVETAIAMMKRDDPEGLKELLRSVRREMLPFDSMIPTAARGPIEQATNYNLFTERPIVSPGLEPLPESEQYSDGTSNMAIWLAEQARDLAGIEVSPLRIDHAAQALFGGLGRDIPQLLGGRFPAESGEESDNLLSGRLYVRGGQTPFYTRQIQALYDAFDEATAQARSSRSEETDEARERRLTLGAAVRSVSGLRTIQRRGGREVGRGVQRYMNGLVELVQESGGEVNLRPTAKAISDLADKVEAGDLTAAQALAALPEPGRQDERTTVAGRRRKARTIAEILGR